jgi:hypothetical protein
MSSPHPLPEPRDPDPREIEQAIQRVEEARVLLRLRCEAVTRLLAAMR